MEKWMPVPDYPGYEVSDQGRVRSLDREVRSRWGTPKVLKGKVLSQGRRGGYEQRYPSCTLFRDGERRYVCVHNLMLEAFVGPRPKGAWGLHRDDDPDNNRVENLYWGTPLQNFQDAVESGRHISAVRSARTHCRNGHEFTPENTYIRPAGNRACRVCHCDQVKRAYRRQK